MIFALKHHKNVGLKIGFLIIYRQVLIPMKGEVLENCLTQHVC